jgi:ferredoxin-thioredoxin reductase catalytic subunit
LHNVFQGVIIPRGGESVGKKIKDERQDKRLEILGWAQKHGWVINPSKGYEMYVDNFFKFKACPCDRSRTNCPCTQSTSEVKDKGFCLCRLFWRDLEAFKSTLRRKDEKVTGKEGGAAPGSGGTASG